MLFQFFVVFFFGIVIYDLSGKYKSISFLSPFVIILFALIVAFRNPLEHDTRAYVAFFEKIEVGQFYMPKERFEIGFQVFTSLLKTFAFGDFHLYFFYITLINLIFLHKAAQNFLACIENAKKMDCFLCELLFLCYFGIFYNAIAIRSSLVMSLCIFANSVLVSQKKKILPLLIIVIASFIHNSAIIFGFASFFLFLIKPVRRNTLFFFWIITGIFYFGNLLASVVICFVQNPLFLSVLDSVSPALSKLFRFYVNSTWTIDFGVAKRFVLYYILEFVFIKKYDEKQKAYGKILLVYAVGMFIMTAGRMIAQIERISDYFVMYQPFLIFACLNKQNTVLKSHYLYYASLVGLIFCQTVFSVNLFNMGLLKQFQ